MAPKWAWTEVVVEDLCEVQGLRSLEPAVRPHRASRLHPAHDHVQPFTNAPVTLPRPETREITNGASAAHGDNMYASEAAKGHARRQGVAGGDKPHIFIEGVHKTLRDFDEPGQSLVKPAAVAPGKKFPISPAAQLSHPHDTTAWTSELAVTEPLKGGGPLQPSVPALPEVFSLKVLSPSLLLHYSRA